VSVGGVHTNLTRLTTAAQPAQANPPARRATTHGITQAGTLAPGGDADVNDSRVNRPLVASVYGAPEDAAVGEGVSGEEEAQGEEEGEVGVGLVGHENRQHHQHELGRLDPHLVHVGVSVLACGSVGGRLG
jgi:hypothetical protein